MTERPITVQEFMDFALEYDLALLAHGTYWSISKGKVSAGDNVQKMIDLERTPEEDVEIENLVQQNFLGIGRIKLFVVQTRQPGWYAFYLAENVLDADGLHRDLFGETSVHVTRSERLMIPYMYFADLDKDQTIYEYRKNVVQFPAYVGHAMAGQHIIHRWR